MSQIIVLGRWLELADDTYETSRREMFKRISEKNLLHVPAYLLHWSVELYLKAFLLHHDAFVRGHNLNNLFIRCLAIDQRLNDISFRNDEVPFDQKYWIEKINIYGENGGMRYLDSTRPVWEFQVTIYDFLDDLVRYIRENVDKNKDISGFI